MRELPDAWSWKRLGEVCEVVLGQSPPGTSYNDQGIGTPFFQGKAEFGNLHPTVRKWTTEPKKFAAAGDVLVSVRAPVGPTNIATVDCAVGRGLAALRAGPELDQAYLLHAVRATAHVLAAQATGSTFAAVSGKTLREHPIPLAPLDEQRRIVAVIDDLFSRLEAASTSVLAASARLKSLRRTAAGDLLKGDWELAKLGDVVENLDGRRIPLKKDDRNSRPGRYPYYGAQGVIDSIDDYIFDGPHLLIAEDGANLLTRSKPIAFQANGQFWVNNHAHVVRPREGVRLEFLEIAINHLDIRSSITGSAQPKLTQANLNRLRVPVPTAEEQDYVVTIFERLTTLADSLGTELRRTATRGERLRSSILAAAFSGQLTFKETISV